MTTELEKRLALIETRNERVSRDKKWETSLTRRVCICLITYLGGAALFMFVMPSAEWYLAACVPVMGYILSTLGLVWVRRFWEKGGACGK